MKEMKTKTELISERRKPKLKPSFILQLIGVVMIAVSLFLPYLTAVGDMAAYIEINPSRVEFESLGMTAEDCANVPIITVKNIITGIYGEDDGTIANIIVLVFCGCLALTALFVILKKPIASLIFNLFAGSVFFFLDFLMKEDFISRDKYAWGIGYYTTLLAILVIFASSIWMLVVKIRYKKSEKELMQSDMNEQQKEGI